MGFLGNFLSLIKSNLGKIFAAALACLVFIFILFPFDDLGDLVSTQVSNVSGNSVYVQFDRLRMSLFPTPGVELEQVYVESIHTPALSAKEITITPSISGMIQQKPYGHISAKGLLKGDVEINMGKGNRSDNGVERHKLDISAKKLSLTDIRELANLPVMLKGQLDLQSTALADLSFQEQPDVEVQLNVSQFELPPASINIPSFGPLTLPELKLSTLELKGRLAAGRFIIETGSIGKLGDDLHGTVTGNIGLNIANMGGSFSPQMNDYTLNIDITANPSFQSRAVLFLNFLDGYKVPSAQGAHFKMKIVSTGPGMPPNISAMR